MCAHLPPHVGKRTCAGAHTHTGCTQFHTNASQPVMCRSQSERKFCESHWTPPEQVGWAQGSLRLPPRGWTLPHFHLPHKGTLTQDNDGGTHTQVTGLRAGAGESSKQSDGVGEEGAPLPPPLPSQRVSVQPIRPNLVAGPRSQADVPILQPPSPAKTAARERVVFFFFSFLNIYIYLYYVYYIYNM